MARVGLRTGNRNLQVAGSYGIIRGAYNPASRISNGHCIGQKGLWSGKKQHEESMADGIRGQIIRSCGNVFADMGLPDTAELDSKTRLGAVLHLIVKQQRLK
jgi:hypothetical protein